MPLSKKQSNNKVNKLVIDPDARVEPCRIL